MARHARDSAAPLRRSPAGWMPARVGRLSAGAGIQSQFAKRCWWRSWWGGYEHCSTRQVHSTLQLNAPELGWLFAVLLFQNPIRSQQTASGAWCQLLMKWLKVWVICDVSNLSNVTPRYLGSEQKGRISLLYLTFSSHLASLLLRWNAADNVFAVLSFSFQVWRYSPSVAMSLVSTPSTACQSPSACMIARSSAWWKMESSPRDFLCFRCLRAAASSSGLKGSEILWHSGVGIFHRSDSCLLTSLVNLWSQSCVPHSLQVARWWSLPGGATGERNVQTSQ